MQLAEIGKQESEEAATFPQQQNRKRERYVVDWAGPVLDPME